MTTNYISRVAIVGATGNLGAHITSALLANTTNPITLTALTRSSSSSHQNLTSHASLIIKTIDYDHPKTLVEALKDQEVLIITLSGLASNECQEKLINAAAEAGVKWVFTNEWGPDTGNEEIVKGMIGGEEGIFGVKEKVRQQIQDLGKSNFISLVTGFWYEWSLSNPPAFGFDFQKRTATFFDEGETRFGVSSWEHIAKIVAKIVSLPIKPTSEQEISLSFFSNKILYTSLLTTTQTEIFSSVQRVTGTTPSEWTISHQLIAERYSDGLEEIKEGKKSGWAKVMYSRGCFWGDGSGDLETKRGLVDDLLGVEKVEGKERERVLDEMTRGVWEVVKEGGGRWVD